MTRFRSKAARSLPGIAGLAMLVVAVPALAQFDNIFGPPRPPADVPAPEYPVDERYPREPDRSRPDPWRQQRGPEPPPPPLTRLPPSEQSTDPRERYPSGPRPGVQSQPLPPPSAAPGAPEIMEEEPESPPAAAPVPEPETAARPPDAGPGPSPLPGLPPGQRQPRGTPQPGSAPGEPGAIVVPPPKQRIVNPTAVFAGLDKITARIISFEVAVDETVQFGALRLTPRACYTRPPTEPPSTDGFVEVDEITLQGEVKRIFTGWMFAASPGLHAIEHPIYDVWLTDCKQEPPQVAEAQGGGSQQGAQPEPAAAAPDGSAEPAPSGRGPPSGPVPSPPIVPR